MNLNPAPWVFSENDSEGNVFPVIYSASCEPGQNLVATLSCSGHLSGNLKCNRADGEFIALARNAFDVMMRRRWYAAYEDGAGDPCFSGWYAVEEHGVAIDMSPVKGTKEYPIKKDPFTALVEADKWYRGNVEKLI
jgi:hypothetical protein